MPRGTLENVLLRFGCLLIHPVVGHFDGFIKRGFGGLVILGFFDAAIVDQLLARINGFG